MGIDYETLAAHVSSCLKALKIYGHGNTATTRSLQYVLDELMEAGEKDEVEWIAREGISEDLAQLVRVCLTNPGDVRGFIEANYPKEFATYSAPVVLPSGNNLAENAENPMNITERDHQATKQPEWTCPDCCVRPCSCEFMPRNEQPDDWPANIVAERQEVSGKWVLWYLTDEQAAICQRALPPLPEEQCGICGDYHEGDVPRSCETGDGE